MIRGDEREGRFRAFRVGADGRVTAAMHVNDRDAAPAVRQLVELGARIDAREARAAAG